MLTGIDVSHHNDLKKIRSIMDKESHDFMWIKATEGISYIDPQLVENYNIALEYSVVPGFYHYAKANMNTAAKEARFFYDTIKPFLNGGCLLALDWEGKSLDVSFKWIEDFCGVLESLVNGKCIIYISAANFPAYKKAFHDNGLWLAHWGADYSNYPYKNDYLIAFHQTGIKDGIDYDLFFGDRAQLSKYMCYNKESERCFIVSPSDLKNYTMKKRPYLLTTDSRVKYGEMTAYASDGCKVKINVTDIVHFTISTGSLYIVTGE